MKTKSAAPVGRCRSMLAAAVALALSSPMHAADPDPKSPHAAADRATAAERAAETDRASFGETKPADNTAHNERDAAGNKLTPLDQSHAESDVEMTRSIRKMLVDDDTLGTNAQNVKVITVDGKVTLRGPVATASERTRVVAIAEKVAGADRVVSELEVITR
jgi:hyperosmotically inducible periplasmic protein